MTFTLADGVEEKFLSLMQDKARKSLSFESGCLRLDVCIDAQNPKTVFLYEIYEDEAAFDVHKTQKHYAAFSKATHGMVEEKHVKTYKLVGK